MQSRVVGVGMALRATSSKGRRAAMRSIVPRVGGGAGREVDAPVWITAAALISVKSADLVDHDLDNLSIGMHHAFTGQCAEVGDRIIDAVFDDAFVAGDARIIECHEH